MARLDPTGVSRILTYIKTWITGLLSNKSDSTHTHSDYIPKSGGGVISGESIGKTNNTSRLILCGGTDVNNGGSVTIYGKDSSTGDVTIQSNDGTNHHQLRLNSNGTATWDSKNLAMQEDTVPRGGGAVLIGSSFSRTVNNSELQINGGTGWGQGASIALGGKDKTGNTGVVYMHAHDATSYNQIEVWPNGSVVQNLNGTINHVAMQEDVVPRSGGGVMTGTTIGKVHNSTYLNLCGGLDWSNGSTVSVYGNDAENAGVILLHPYDGTQEKTMWLRPNGTWTWGGQAVQLVSDQRLKQQISEIDDKLLDAWEDVTLCQFKYNDAVNEKGDNARLHTGYVVQQIDEACKSHNVDISAYGLYCHEEYPQETEEVEIEQEDGTKVKETKVIREASEHYSLRYTETLVVECAYLRREVKRLSERLEKMEK